MVHDHLPEVPPPLRVKSKIWEGGFGEVGGTEEDKEGLKVVC